MTEAEWNASTDPMAMMAHLQWEPTTYNMQGSGWRRRKVSERKLRLFACACARQVWDKLTDDSECFHCVNGVKLGPSHTPQLRQFLPPLGNGSKCSNCHGTGRVNRSRNAVEVAERFADGLATKEDLLDAEKSWHFAGPHAGCHTLPSYVVWPDAQYGALKVTQQRVVPPAVQAAYLRDIFNPFRHATFDPAWRTPDVNALACVAYVHRDQDVMGPLADALMEAGCADKGLLNHCRGWDKCGACLSGWIPRTNGWFGADPCRRCESAGTGHEGLIKSGQHVRGCWAVDAILGRE